MSSFVTFVGEESGLAEARQEVGDWLAGQGVAGRLAFHVKLVAHEAARTALAHAEPAEAVAVCAMVCDNGDVLVEVQDPHVPPWEALGDPKPERVDGVSLIRGLCRCVGAVPDRHGGTSLVAVVDSERAR